MKKKMSLLVALVLAVVVTGYSVSGTYAKYTSQATGTATARVAKWAFDVNDAKKSTQTTFTFDLFKTINDTLDGNEETDVKKAGTGETAIIAPGTQGSFDIVLTNKSEVTAEYAIDYTVTNTGFIPVEFSVDNGATWTTDLADVVADGTTKLAMDNGSNTITVQWRWAFVGADSENYKAQTDAADTALGEADTAATLTVTAAVTATQVD